VGKLLLILAALLLVYVAVKAFQRGSRRSPGPSAGGRSVEDMVRCARCGVHLPRSESLLSGGEFFCSEEHRRQHTRS
jgi:uncharacterized protein